MAVSVPVGTIETMRELVLVGSVVVAVVLGATVDEVVGAKIKVCDVDDSLDDGLVDEAVGVTLSVAGSVPFPEPDDAVYEEVLDRVNVAPVVRGTDVECVEPSVLVALAVAVEARDDACDERLARSDEAYEDADEPDDPDVREESEVGVGSGGIGMTVVPEPVPVIVLSV